MNRREFSLGLVGMAGVAALSGLALPLPALAQGAVEGKTYNRLKTPVRLDKTGKIEVVEFFWYACPHCFAFEPTLEPWVAKLPADVHFRRVPVSFDNALKEIHQQIFYTWDALGLVEAMHTKTFNRFHVQRKPIDSESDMLQFAQESGLDVPKVKAAWESFSTKTHMKQADELSQAYECDGVPELGIQGLFTTSPADANGPQNAVAVADQLIAQVRKGG